ncbi:MAG: hypothetical protein CL532_10145 [Aestuariivita sp.]|nr:hypothetical protein [Aestuariivita sp.]
MSIQNTIFNFFIKKISNHKQTPLVEKFANSFGQRSYKINVKTMHSEEVWHRAISSKKNIKSKFGDKFS